MSQLHPLNVGVSESSHGGGDFHGNEFVPAAPVFHGSLAGLVRSFDPADLAVVLILRQPVESGAPYADMRAGDSGASANKAIGNYGRQHPAG